MHRTHVSIPRESRSGGCRLGGRTIFGALTALALAGCTSGSLDGDGEWERRDASFPSSSVAGQPGAGFAGNGGGPIAGAGIGPVAGTGGTAGGGPSAGAGGSPFGGAAGGPFGGAAGGPVGGAAGAPARLDGGLGVDAAPPAMPWGPLTYQAEDARSSNNAINRTNRQGFTGRGYVEVTFFTPNVTVDFAIDTPGGATEIEVRYVTLAGFGGVQARTVDLFVGSTKVGTVSLPAAGTTWSVGKVTVMLPAGKQTLRLTLPQGGLALDSITLRGSGQTPPPPPRDGGVTPPPRMDAAMPPPMDTAAPPPPPPPPPPPEGCDAPAIVFTPNCATVGCHVEGPTAPNLTASANLFANLKAAVSMRGCRDTAYVDTNNVANSAIIRAIKGTCGTKMPIGIWRSGNENDAVTCITKWIQAGGK